MANVIPSKNRMDNRKIPNTKEIDCSCGSKMKRTTVKECYPDKYKSLIITCSNIQKDDKKCENILIGGLDDGAGEFFRCENEHAQRMHGEEEFDFCLVCAGLTTQDEIIRLKQQTALQQADLISSLLQNELEKDDAKAKDAKELIAIGVYLQHKAFKPEQAITYFQKALNIANEKLLQKDKYNENEQTKLLETKFEALNHFASALRDCKKYDESEQKFEQAAKFYKQNNEVISGIYYANLLSNYGILLKRMEKFKKAEIQYVTGIDIATKMNDYQTKAFLCNSYALMLEQNLNEISKAEEYYIKAIECSDNNDEKENVSHVMANEYNDSTFRKIEKKNFLFEQNYIVFLKNICRINDMEIRINKMIERYKNLINENQEIDKKQNNLKDENKYILSRLYIWLALSIMRHPKLIKNEIINGENCLQSAIKLDINKRRVYSAYAMYLQIIGRRIDGKFNKFGFPNEVEQKNDGEGENNSDKKEDWKQNYCLSNRREDIKKYYILSINNKQHIDVKIGFTFFETAPKTQQEISFSKNNCINELNEIFKRSSQYRDYVIESKKLAEYLIILYPNEYELHFIYALTLFRYGNSLYNLELALIYYEIGLSLFQYDIDYIRDNQRGKILASHYMQQYKKLKQEIGQLIQINKLFESEIEKIKRENKVDDNKVLFDLYLKYAGFIQKELKDTKKATEYFKLCYDMNNKNISVCYNYAVNIHELNNENENNSQLFGDYKIADTLFQNSIHLFFNQVIDEDNEMKKNVENDNEMKEKEEPKKCQIFYGRCLVYIEQMTCKKSKRKTEEIVEMYEYLLKKYYNEQNKDMKIGWIDFYFEYIQFLVKHKKDNKILELLVICEKYAWELYYDNKIVSQMKPVLIQRIAEIYALIERHREWQTLLDKCINDKDTINEIDKHNILYYYGYLYETSLNDYKNAMIYYKKAMDMMANDKREGTRNGYALYAAVYANCLRVVNKDYVNCEKILKEAMKTVEKNDLKGRINSVPHNMYQKYLAEMKQIEDEKQKKVIVDDGPKNEEKEVDNDTHNNEDLRQHFGDISFIERTNIE